MTETEAKKGFWLWLDRTSKIAAVIIALGAVFLMVRTSVLYLFPPNDLDATFEIHPVLHPYRLKQSVGLPSVESAEPQERSDPVEPERKEHALVDSGLSKEEMYLRAKSVLKVKLRNITKNSLNDFSIQIDGLIHADLKVESKFIELEAGGDLRFPKLRPDEEVQVVAWSSRPQHHFSGVKIVFDENSQVIGSLDQEKRGISSIIVFWVVVGMAFALAFHMLVEMLSVWKKKAPSNEGMRLLTIW